MRLKRKREPRGAGASANSRGGESTRPPADPQGGEHPRASVPTTSMVLMAVFLVGGSLGLVARWPAGPANLDWGVWTVVYGGYAYVVLAALFHARTGR